MGAQGGTVQRVMERFATRQHGVVSRSQLVGAGVTRREIARRLETGELLVEFRGVYRVGHRAPSVHARYMAAVLACGEGAALSGRAAAHLLGLLRGPAPQPEVSAPVKRRIEGITTHRTRSTHPLDATTWQGIPTTTVPRTLIDLARTLAPHDLARAAHEAGIKHNTTPTQVDDLLARRRNAPGARKLRAVLHGDTPTTLSALEEKFLAILIEHGLPLPETNRPAGAHSVDCRWPEHHPPSSSTATATTGPATPGSRTAGASARPTPEATSTAATRTATCSRTPGR
jgi:hypothetical protein